MPFSELFFTSSIYYLYIYNSHCFLLHPCACAFVRPARRCRPAGLRSFEGDKDSVTAVGSSAYDKPEKWWARPWDLLGFSASASATPRPQRKYHTGPRRCLAWHPDAEKTDAATPVKNLWLRVSQLWPASNRTLGEENILMLVHWYWGVHSWFTSSW